MWKKLKFKYLNESIGLCCGVMIVGLMLRFALKVELNIIDGIFSILLGSYGMSIIIYNIFDIIKKFKYEEK